MYSPFGCQTGLFTRRKSSLVTACALPPSASITQALSPPAASLMYAMRLPSGEKRGCISHAIECVSALASPPSIGSVYRSPSRSNTSVLPSGLRSTLIQVPVRESMEAVAASPGGAFTSHFFLLSLSLSFSSSAPAASESEARPASVQGSRRIFNPLDGAHGGAKREFCLRCAA